MRIRLITFIIFIPQYFWGQALTPPPAPTGFQSNPTSSVPIQSISTGSSDTSTASPAGSGAGSGATDANLGLGDNKNIKTKYEEYQSICRSNKYDNINYFNENLKNKRISYLKDKISKANSETAIKFELRLAKEFTDQKRTDDFLIIQKKLKEKNLSYVENEYLNALASINYKKSPTARAALVNLVKDKTEIKKLVESMILLAEIYVDAGNYYEAETIYEDLNKEFNNSYLVQQCEAMVLNSSNAEGELLCLKASEKFPENPFPLIFAGITNREREDLKKAIVNFKKSIRIKPTEMGHVCLAEVYYMSGNFKQSAEEFQKSLEIVPESERAYLGLAWTQIKMKNYKEALSAFDTACKMNGKNQFELRKAFKVLSEQKINQAVDFINLANNCTR